MVSDNKEKILEQARILFAQKGFDGCRVEEIARAASVNKAMIYYHFRDKLCLYEAVLERNLAGFLDRVRTRLAPIEDPADRLAAFINAFAANFTGSRGMGRLMLRELADDGARLPEGAGATLSALIMELDQIVDALTKGSAHRPATLVVYLMIVGTMNIFTSTEQIRNRFALASPDMGFQLTADEAAAQIHAVIAPAFGLPLPSKP